MMMKLLSDIEKYFSLVIQQEREMHSVPVSDPFETVFTKVILMVLTMVDVVILKDRKEKVMHLKLITMCVHIMEEQTIVI